MQRCVFFVGLTEGTLHSFGISAERDFNFCVRGTSSWIIDQLKWVCSFFNFGFFPLPFTFLFCLAIRQSPEPGCRTPQPFFFLPLHCSAGLIAKA